jgi:hypothetical protein
MNDPSRQLPSSSNAITSISRPPVYVTIWS